MVVIILIIVIFVWCAFRIPNKLDDVKPVQQVQGNTAVKPAQPTQSEEVSVGWIKEFFHGYVSLNRKYEIEDSGVIISWDKGDLGYDIFAMLKVEKIDEKDAAEAVKSLRNAIAMAKKAAKESAALDGGDSTGAIIQGYEISNQMILNFYGTDHLQGSFWDIDDCEFVDGKYLLFTTGTLVLTEHSLQAMLKEIKNVAKEFGTVVDCLNIAKNAIRIRIS